MSSPQSFVEGWNIIETLGEGAYGEVELLVQEGTGCAIAVKTIDIRKHRDAAECVKKEERIHRILIHPNVIRFLGKRIEPSKVFLFLEYASGGELFNRIEPNYGMSSGEAQKYMKQLLSGVQYIHEKGVAHRDLKPENILLDEHSNVKISDFGLATIFRLHGKERLLDKKCGTLPYVAPDVLKGPHHAEPADVWSCGIIFVAMLAGELPWDEPTEKCEDYVEFTVESGLLKTPWSKLEMVALSLARKMLTNDPKQRPKISQILQHPWMKTKFPDTSKNYEVLTFFQSNLTGAPKPSEVEEVIDNSSESSERPAKRRSTFADDQNKLRETPDKSVALSQPTPAFPSLYSGFLVSLLQQTCPQSKRLCFSQPTNNEDLILGSQIQFTQSPVTYSNFSRLTKRMTRFFVKGNYEDTITSLGAAADKLHYSWTSDVSGVITVSTVDSRKMKLVFKANLIDMKSKLLLDFRLSKGCGLEFKKRFVKLKSLLSDIVLSV